MNDLNFERLRRNLTNYYRKSFRDLTRKEKRYCTLPMQELLVEITEMRGFLRGLKKSLDFIESKMADAELPLEEE